MRPGGIFGKGGLSGIEGGGLFGPNPVAGLGAVRTGGVFGTNAVGELQTLTGGSVGPCPAATVTACKTSCANVAAKGGNVDQCVGACCLVGGPAKAANCQTNCKTYRQDTPEWAQCIQKCQGYAPVDYSKEKSGCEKAGKIYSWLDGGCVNKNEFESCPAGTMFATYPDGSKKCIAETDVTKTTCPAGTTLSTVPGGKTCVSPVKPTDTPVKPTDTPAKKAATPAKPTATPAETFQTKQSSMFGNPMVLAGLAAVGIGAAILLTGNNKKGKNPVKFNRRGQR
jgi:hypothetical protein